MLPTPALHALIKTSVATPNPAEMKTTVHIFFLLNYVHLQTFACQFMYIYCCT